MAKKKDKQSEFMFYYGPNHERFVRYCKAKSYGIIDYKDLINETLMRAYNSFDKIENKQLFIHFLYGIASNIIKNELRSNAKKKNVELVPDNIEQITENSAIQKFEIEILYNALNKLPEKQKEAIILFEISGYSIKEISEIQASNISAVKQRLKRGREKLASIIGANEINDEKINKKSQVLFTLFL